MYNNLNDKSVLYIEDDPVVLSNISKLLGNYFADIFTASDGETGYKEFIQKRELIDIMIVDIELPKLNGIELIKKIRKIDEDLPIVVISAYTKVDYLLESVELKLDKYIVKPFTTKKLYKLLEKLDQSLGGDDSFSLAPNVVIDRLSRMITTDEETLVLTQRELECLELLENKGIITYDELDSLWKDTPPTPDAIRSFIKALRKKLPPGFLKNRQNIGYFIEKDR